MNVEVINVGTELLLGEIINTEAPVLFKMCKELGFDIYHQTTVGDNPQRLLECLDIAFKRGLIVSLLLQDLVQRRMI